MKRKTIHIWLVILLVFCADIDISAQRAIRPAPVPCIDCSVDSIQHWFAVARESKDSLIAYVALLDALSGPESHPELRQALSKLIELNQKADLFDDKPYRIFLEAIIDWDQKDTLESIEKFKEAIFAFDQQHRIQSISGVLSSIRIYYNYANLQEARLAYYKEKLAYYTVNGPLENTASCLHGIAGYYLYKADYNTAISYYLRAAEIYKPFSPNGYSNELIVAGMTYYRWGNIRKAIPYLKEGYKISFQIRNFGNAQLSTLILSLIAKQSDQLDEALALTDTCLTLLRLPGDLDFMTIVLAEKGGILIEMGQPDKAYPYISSAIAARDSARIPIVTVHGDFDGYFYLYQYYKLKGELQQAEITLLQYYFKASESKSNAQILTANKELAIFYTQAAKNNKAISYALKYISLSDSLHDVQKEFNISEYEKQQEALANEREVHGLEEQKEIQRNYFIGGAVVLLLLSVGIYSRLQYVRKVKKQLVEKNIQIEKARLHAEQSERFKQEFLANMSHEIRTPMNAVMGMTNLLMDKKPRHDQIAYLSGIQKSSDTLLHIINDILDLSKIEAGKIDLEEIDFSIRQEVKQVKLLLDHKAIEKGIHLILNIAHDVPDVLLGDPVRLNQVLINLAGNAIKFTEKGSVTVEVSKGQGAGGMLRPGYPHPFATAQQPEQGAVGNSQSAVGYLQSAVGNMEYTPPEKTHLLFKVSDTGIGIPADKLDQVFESFSQAHSSDNRKFGGTGLGLSISKQLVELMGGTIAVASEEGSGTTFSFEIEYLIGSADNLLKTKSHDQMDGSVLNGLRILVVDDNEFNRTVARDTLLSKCDVDITEAVNGQEALDLLRDNEYDVILMDVQMPVMDGFEATRQIRETFPEPKNKIQIIALTASVVRSDLDKCRAAGMDDYVAKPFKAMQLLGTIAKASGREIRHLEPSVITEFVDKAQLTTLTENQIKPVTDLTYLDKFCEGDTGRMNKYINMFLDTASGLTERITLALEQENYEEIASQIHAYKTKWIMMGMTEAKDLALIIEQACRENGDTNSIRKNIDYLLTLIQKAVSELKGYSIQSK